MADPENKALVSAPEQVLATMRGDGTRRWVRPRLSLGRFLSRRKALAWVLMLFFVVAPIIQVGGKPLILLDLPARQFTLAGTTFAPTETPLLMVALLALFVSVFLITALFGRVWCGYACPQTVYMEFLFRPIERLFEGSYAKQRKLDETGGGSRRFAKNVTIAAISCFLAHTFLAYFVGWEQLLTWMRGSPSEHPAAFAVMGVTTALMVADFTYFREQVCLVACPYGRLQSALFDRHTLIVGYDTKRGEPRGKLKKKKLPLAEGAPTLGDCIDCRACVTTCPTGIDIRRGLQLECIGCAQCIDACDTIMDKVGRERGLIRYTSESELAGERKRFVRARVAIYSVFLTGLAIALAILLATRSPIHVRILRDQAAPYTKLESGEVANQVRLKVQNKSDEPVWCTVELPDVEDERVNLPENPFKVEPYDTLETTVHVRLPVDAFERGRRQLILTVSTGEATEEVECTLNGPRSFK